MARSPIPHASDLPALYSSAAAAEVIGIQPSEICKRADHHGVGTRTVGGGVRIFTEADFPALRTPTGKVGNPTFGRKGRRVSRQPIRDS